MPRRFPCRWSTPNVLIASLLVIGAMRLARDILVPMALAVLLSFLLAPLVGLLQRWLGRVASVVVVTSFSLLVVVGVGWLVVGQVTYLAEQLPAYEDNIREKVQSVKAAVSQRLERASRTVGDIAQELDSPATDPAAAAEVPTVAVTPPPPDPSVTPLRAARDFLGPILRPITTASVIAVIVIFLLIYYDDVRDRILRLVGVDQISEATHTLEDASARVSRYLYMHTLVNAIHGVAVAIGFYFIGLPAAMFWGLFAALLRFVPYLGPVLAAVFPVVLGFAVFDGWSQTLLLILFLVMLELVSNNILEPWLYGASTGLSPVAVVVAAVFWTWLWGTPGLALSAPLTVCLVVLGRHVGNLEFLSILLSDQPVLEARVKVYQRLLALKQDAAWDVVAQERKNKSVQEVYEEVLLPALAMAETDRHDGDVDTERADFVLAGVREFIEDAAKERQDEEDGKTFLTNGAERIKMLCVPARDEADELAGLMLTELLKKRGLSARNASEESLVGELLDRMDQDGVDIVCISALPPRSATHARHLYRRVRERFEHLPVVIAVWTGEGDVRRLRDRLPDDDALDFASTLTAACETIQKLSQRLAGQVLAETR